MSEQLADLGKRMGVLHEQIRQLEGQIALYERDLEACRAEVQRVSLKINAEVERLAEQDRRQRAVADVVEARVRNLPAHYGPAGPGSYEQPQPWRESHGDHLRKL